MSNPNGNIPDYKDENCTMCKFFCTTQSVCCRFPPQGESRLQPSVSKFDWCGEFKTNEPTIQ